MSETHVASFPITWAGRYLRQRCAWCGKTILDYDLERVAVQIPEDGTPPKDPTPWPTGALIRKDGPMSTIVYDGDADDISVEEMAPDACLNLDPEVTR